jgi:hypothetical protein
VSGGFTKKYSKAFILEIIYIYITKMICISEKFYIAVQLAFIILSPGG